MIHYGHSARAREVFRQWICGRRSGTVYSKVTVFLGLAGLAGVVCGSANAQAVEGLTVAPDRLTRPIAEERPAASLMIASWNLTDAVAAGVVERFQPAPAAWRHTFGAERRFIRNTNAFDPSAIQADIVLLQGIKTVREVSKLFPARRWKVMVSRQILSVGGRRGLSASRVPAGFSTTAIVVRYRRGLRVTGQEHLLELAAAGADGVAPEIKERLSQAGETGKDGEAVVERAQAGLAVRVLYEGQVVWLVSVALPSRCLSKDAACAERAVLARWVKARQADGFPVILGGRLGLEDKNSVAPEENKAGKKTTDKKSGCAAQSIDGDAKLSGRGRMLEDAGCIAILTLDAPARRSTVRFERERAPLDDVDLETYEERITEIADDDLF